MIVLDTNVISELMKGPAASPNVVRFVRLLTERPVTTVINRAEILSGVMMLPPGPARSRLHDVAESAFGGLGVVLPLIGECAAQYADIVATRRRTGRPIGAMDAFIAAIAREAAATVATRDLSDFDGLGLDLVDPWAT